MTFAEEYRVLHEDTLRKIIENRDYPYECLIIKKEYEEHKRFLMEKYRKIDSDR